MLCIGAAEKSRSPLNTHRNMSEPSNAALVSIIGGGLAGCEAAWQLASRSIPVRLYDMKPHLFSPAHQSPDLAELVCSNSLRSNDPHSAVGLLKNEMRDLDSLIMRVADQVSVPAGKALAVDRARFSSEITQHIETHQLIHLIREEIKDINALSTPYTIIASGPLTSASLAEAFSAITDKTRLFFYDAIAPIVYADSLDMAVIYEKSRYQDGPGDYLNCPMDRSQYDTFLSALQTADYVPLHDFEDEKYFEGCLPIEVICSRGKDTLRFGPMKPVGLENTHTGKIPYAVVQLRKENTQGTLYNMVGFQTKLTYTEQKRIFTMIPGMEQVRFARFGSIHRNTFICAPEILEPSLQLKMKPDTFVAGQLSGVEGYVESTAIGLLAGINCYQLLKRSKIVPPPADTAFGALLSHLVDTDPSHFQPSNINFGLFPAWEKKVPKRLRGQVRAERSAAARRIWFNELKQV